MSHEIDPDRRDASGVREMAIEGAEPSIPDWESLTDGLRSALEDPGIEVSSRRPNPRPGKRAMSEIVDIRTSGSYLQLFCKYGGETWHSHGLWGVDYEVEVYRNVLSRIEVGTPRLIGVHREPRSGNPWLILENLDGCYQLTDAPQPEALADTARWLGRIHNVTGELLSREGASSSFLKRLDEEYYEGWLRRLGNYAAAKGLVVPWLERLREAWADMARVLAATPVSVVHGDMYASNVLVCPQRGPVVIDWESAAVGAGEVDLAFLTAGWPHETVRRCEREYRESRWPGAESSDFELRLRAAHLFQSIRWLGDHPDWASAEGLNRLRDQAVALGVDLRGDG